MKRPRQLGVGGWAQTAALVRGYKHSRSAQLGSREFDLSWLAQCALNVTCLLTLVQPPAVAPRKRVRQERYDVDFVDDSELAGNRSDSVRPMHQGFYINHVRVLSLHP